MGVEPGPNSGEVFDVAALRALERGCGLLGMLAGAKALFGLALDEPGQPKVGAGDISRRIGRGTQAHGPLGMLERPLAIAELALDRCERGQDRHQRLAVLGSPDRLGHGQGSLSRGQSLVIAAELAQGLGPILLQRDQGRVTLTKRGNQNRRRAIVVGQRPSVIVERRADRTEVLQGHADGHVLGPEALGQNAQRGLVAGQSLGVTVEVLQRRADVDVDVGDLGMLGSEFIDEDLARALERRHRFAVAAGLVV